MPIKIPQSAFTPAQQAVRARLATLNPTQFTALRSVLQQATSAVDVRIAQLEAERARLADQKKKLVTVLTAFGKPAALDHLRDTILKGHKFVASTASTDKTPKPVKPKKPKRPGH
jgi:hypothetical protein